MLNPPQTNKCWPVVKLASSDMKYATAAAMSSGLPMRFMGMRAIWARVAGLSGGLFLFHISVSVGPGPTALTVMPFSASSSAQLRVIAASPALAAVYDDVVAR